MKRKTLFFILILCITPGKCWHIDKCWQSFDRKTAHRRTESLAYFSYIHWIKHNCLIINANWYGHLELPLTTSPLISSHYVYTQQMENMYYRFCHRQVNQTTPVVKNNAKTFLMQWKFLFMQHNTNDYTNTPHYTHTTHTDAELSLEGGNFTTLRAHLL